MPLSSVWAGPSGNDHLAGPPLLMAKTAGSTPFRLSTHVGDVGHMLVVGPTGAGKSVLLAALALQFRRYGQAQVSIFDKGFSARAAVLACGGAHHTPGSGDNNYPPFGGPPRVWAKTAVPTPSRLPTRVVDVGHMLVVGPTGAGKSVLLAALALQFRRYGQAQVYIFDKGFSARAAVLACGGAHHTLGSGDNNSLAFQPLAGIDRPLERSWASEWVAALFEHAKVSVKRSEERRVGKECVSTCRSWWSPDH